jgi:hypothetical protein
MEGSIRFWNAYSVRCALDRCEVVRDAQSAARAVSAPFVLNQTRVRHKRQDLLRDVPRNWQAWQAIFERPTRVAFGPQSMHHEAHLASGATFASGTLCGLVGAESRRPRESQHLIIEAAGCLPPAPESALPCASFSGQQQAYNCGSRTSSEPIGILHWPILARTLPSASYLTMYSGVE